MGSAEAFTIHLPIELFKLQQDLSSVPIDILKFPIGAPRDNFGIRFCMSNPVCEFTTRHR